MRFIAGVLMTLLFVLTAAALLRALPLPPAAGRDVTPLASVVDRARPAEKTVYAEADPFVQITGTESKLFGILQSSRLLVAGGHCTAGIDFERYPLDIRVDPSGPVTVTAAEPELFGCGITEERFFDGTGLVPASPGLSNQLADGVMQELRDAAIRSGILKTAKDNAAARLELRLRQVADAFGAPVGTVIVEFRRP